VIRGGEAGKRGARWHKFTFTLDNFLALKGLINDIVDQKWWWRETSREPTCTGYPKKVLF